MMGARVGGSHPQRAAFDAVGSNRTTLEVGSSLGPALLRSLSWLLISQFVVCWGLIICFMLSKRFCISTCPRDLSSRAPGEGAAWTPQPARPYDTTPTTHPADPALIPLLPRRLWRLDDEFYDLTAFIPTHPGGSLVIAQSEGTEISALFHSHHLAQIPEALLSKYRLSDVTPEMAASIPACPYSFADDGFFHTLKRRVVASGFDGAHCSQVTRAYTVCKVLGTLALFALTWAGVCFLPLGRVSVALALVNQWTRMCLTGIGHEAIHGRCKNWLTWELFNMMYAWRAAIRAALFSTPSP